jgi:hypothetical protein
MTFVYIYYMRAGWMARTTVHIYLSVGDKKPRHETHSTEDKFLADVISTVS